MKKEVATARLFLVFIVFAVITMFFTPELVGPGGKRVGISPRMWPYVSLGLLLLFAVGGFFINLRKHSLSITQILDQTLWNKNKKQIFLVVFLIAYIFSMEYFGYIVSSCITLLSLFYFFGARKHSVNIILSSCFVLVTYILFVEVFKISLPVFALM